MVYALIYDTDFGLEVRTDIHGTVSLEKYTDNRILNIYGKLCKHIYKVYADSTCICLK